MTGLIWEARLFVGRRLLCPLAMWFVRRAIACEGHHNIRSKTFWLRFGQNAAYVGWADSNAVFEEWSMTWLEVDGE